MGSIQSPMPDAKDYVYPPQWALASTSPFPGSPLQSDTNPSFPIGYTPPVKLPGLTSASGNYYSAAGVTLNATVGRVHTAVQVVGASKKEVGTEEFYDTFGSRTAVAANGTPNTKTGPSAGAVLQTGSISQRFSKTGDPNTGQPPFTGE